MGVSGSISNKPVAIAHQVFHDVDLLESVNQANSQRDIRLTQLSLDSLHCEFIMVDYGEARLTFAKPNCPVRCVGPKVKDCIDFTCVLDRRHPTLIAHGYRTSLCTLAGMDTHLETDIVVPAEQIFFTLQVKRSVVEGCVEALNRSDLTEQYWRQNFVCAPETLPSVQAYLREVLTVFQQKPEFLRRPGTKQLILEDLLPLVLDALPPDPRTVPGLSPVSRIELARKAEAYIQDHLEEPLTVEALCKALHTSKRTLFYTFNEVFGLSPMAFLKAHRLQAVRRKLQAAEPGTVEVKMIAEQFGFWGAGHFARDYRAMFGESPRETLKKDP
jgi:AraC family ethanolamine operon transcriptional activator